MSGQGIRDWYRKRLLRNIPFMLDLYDEEAGCFRCEEGYDRDYHRGIYTLAWFYSNEYEDNPYYRDPSILEKMVRTGDAICDAYPRVHDGAHGRLGNEWVALNLLECIDLIGDELGDERRGKWYEAVADHINDIGVISNYVSTAPNHHAWRSALMYRAGTLFDNAAWRRIGEFIARRNAEVITADGYWDESVRGHGPSANYHRTHLHGLDLYYRFSGDEEVRGALEKGVEFAVRAAYPDGSPIDTFDGRQPYLSAFALVMGAGALTRTLMGRRLVRAQMALADELGLADATTPCSFALTWYAFATQDFMVDCLRYSEEGPDEPLPQEKDGHRDTFVMGDQQEAHGGGLLRRGPWVVAVSAITSDVPRYSSNVYITERQSGFSLWHEDVGVIVGGGNRMRNHAPLANAVVLTGWRGVDCEAGVFPDELVAGRGLPNDEGAPASSSDPVKCCYYPLRRRLELHDAGASLRLDFLHASIRFDLNVIDERRVEIDFEFETVNVKKLLLQVPVPLFHPGGFEIDGEPFEVGDLEDIRSPEVREQLELTARGRRVRYLLAENAPVSFTFPLEPIKNWRHKKMNYVPDVHFKPLYVVGLLSRAFSAGNGKGRLLDVEVGQGHAS